MHRTLSELPVCSIAARMPQLARPPAPHSTRCYCPPLPLQWMLPDEKRPDAPPQLVETDQTAFKRFLFSVETTHHHLPDTYTDALAQLDR